MCRHSAWRRRSYSNGVFSTARSHFGIELKKGHQCIHSSELTPVPVGSYSGMPEKRFLVPRE